jgi:DHA2 family multidrug resistance protein
LNCHRNPALGQTLARNAYREAATLAYADAFRAIMLAFVVATLLVPLLRQVGASKTPGVSPDSH